LIVAKSQSKAPEPKKRRQAEAATTGMLAPTYMGWTTSGAAFWPRLDPRPAHVLLPFTCDAALGPASQTPRVAGPLMYVSGMLEERHGCNNPATLSHVPAVPTHTTVCTAGWLEMLTAVDMAGETTST
jgi:hypothetical protein